MSASCRASSSSDSESPGLPYAPLTCSRLSPTRNVVPGVAIRPASALTEPLPETGRPRRRLSRSSKRPCSRHAGVRDPSKRVEPDSRALGASANRDGSMPLNRRSAANDCCPSRLIRPWPSSRPPRWLHREPRDRDLGILPRRCHGQPEVALRERRCRALRRAVEPGIDASVERGARKFPVQSVEIEARDVESKLRSRRREAQLPACLARVAEVGGQIRDLQRALRHAKLPARGDQRQPALRQRAGRCIAELEAAGEHRVRRWFEDRDHIERASRRAVDQTCEVHILPTRFERRDLLRLERVKAGTPGYCVGEKCSGYRHLNAFEPTGDCRLEPSIHRQACHCPGEGPVNREVRPRSHAQPPGDGSPGRADAQVLHFVPAAAAAVSERQVVEMQRRGRPDANLHFAHTDRVGADVDGQSERGRQDDLVAARHDAHVHAPDLQRGDVDRTRQQRAQAPFDAQVLQFDAHAPLLECRALDHERARQRTGKAVQLESPAERGLDPARGPAQRVRAAREPQHSGRAGAGQERQDDEQDPDAAEAAGHQNLTPSEKCRRTALVSCP